jgi:hypothetical protein
VGALGLLQIGQRSPCSLGWFSLAGSLVMVFGRLVRVDRRRLTPR